MARRDNAGIKMTGERDLELLLGHMEPRLVPGEYVFCTLGDSQEKLVVAPLLTFREDEGLTVVILREKADELGLKYETIWGQITLQVHSDLTAVGFLAEITHHLANAGISVNVVSAYYHDHLFVPFSKVEKAMDVLESLSDKFSE